MAVVFQPCAVGGDGFLPWNNILHNKQKAVPHTFKCKKRGAAICITFKTAGTGEQIVSGTGGYMQACKLPEGIGLYKSR